MKKFVAVPSAVAATFLKRRLLVLAASLLGALLLFPATGLAASQADDSVIFDGNLRVGAVFYDDQQITMVWHETPYWWITGAECRINVYRSNGDSVGVAQQPTTTEAACDVSLALPRLAPGEYSWWWTRITYGDAHEYRNGSFTVLERPRDLTPPVVPGGLSVSGSTETTLSLVWDASNDDRGVAGYGIYRDATKVADTDARTFSLSGLICGKAYTLAVDAYDAAGNRSGQASISATTKPCAVDPPPTPGPTPPPPNPTPPTPDPTPPTPGPTPPTPSPNPPTPGPTPPTPQPTPTPKLANVWAFNSTGRVGGVARLRIATEVGATYSRYVIKVMGKRGTVATVKAPVLKRGLVQFVSWRVPKTVKPGTLRFIVQALGTTPSKKAEARLVVR